MYKMWECMHNAHRNIHVTSQIQGLYHSHFHPDLVSKAFFIKASCSCLDAIFVNLFPIARLSGFLN